MNRKSQAMIEQIRRMQAANHSIKKMARALGLSRNTVRRYLRQIAVDDKPVELPIPRKDIDWQVALAEAALGRPAKRIYEDLAPPISYSHFSRLLRQQRPTTKPLAIRLNHEPGEKTQVDYATGIAVIDARTGRETMTQFYCGVLPHSSYTFGEFTLSQKTTDFVRSHERMWAYFGGVTPYVVLDNLKSGVIKAHRYDPDINPTYCDYANHTGFAALPARVRTPRDKAAVEAAIGVIQRDFFDKHRSTKFYSLGELNACFRRYLDDFNQRVMADYGVSRLERFALEKSRLRPLAAAPYEIFEWKKAKVHPDCCIELLRSVYSVPYQHAHKYVQVKFSDQLVVIFDESASEVLATHVRQARFKNSIVPDHLPPTKTQLASFDVRRVQKFADLLGHKTRAYVDWQFESEADHPLRALRRLLGLMRFYDTSILGREAMEYAAEQALQYRRKDLNYFKGCAAAFKGHGQRLHLVKAPRREANNIHVRFTEESNDV
jgi:transposase